VAEKAGHIISLFEGSYENIKITTPEDMVVAEALLRSRQ
jgi:2-C-methyl-D-erythritol 4-phosphate cytidylyltransferase